MLLTLLGSDGNGQNSSTDGLYKICELISMTLKDMVTEVHLSLPLYNLYADLYLRLTDLLNSIYRVQFKNRS